MGFIIWKDRLTQKKKLFLLHNLDNTRLAVFYLICWILSALPVLLLNYFDSLTLNKMLGFSKVLSSTDNG